MNQPRPRPHCRLLSLHLAAAVFATNTALAAADRASDSHANSPQDQPTAMRPPGRGLTPFLGISTGPILGSLTHWNVGGTAVGARVGLRFCACGLGAELASGWARVYGGEGLRWRDFDAPARNLFWMRVGPRFDYRFARQVLSVAAHAGLQVAIYRGVGADLTLGWAWQWEQLGLGAMASAAYATTTGDVSTGFFFQLGPEVRWQF